jgi:peptidoglycan/LPS O-acetylase OafA/YrhL
MPALAALIFCLGETAKSSPGNVLGAAPLVYLGEVSYALYMTHLPVDIAYFHGIERLALGFEGPAVWIAWAGVFPASLLAAVLAHHLIERPARFWMRSHDPFAKRPQPEPAHEPVL